MKSIGLTHVRGHWGLVLLAACGAFLFASCDVGGRKTSVSGPEEAVNIPERGNYGPNLLAGVVDTASGSDVASYSLRAEKVGGIDSVRAILSCAERCESGDSLAVPPGSRLGWAIVNLTGRKTEVWTLVGTIGDARIRFAGSDTLDLQLLAGDDTVVTEQVPWIEGEPTTPPSSSLLGGDPSSP